MTDTQHPITPPPELYQKWCSCGNVTEALNQAARWGADQELEACCAFAQDHVWGLVNGPQVADVIRTARRPKPQTLNSIALQMLGTIERMNIVIPEITDTIRQALEQAND